MRELIELCTRIDRDAHEAYDRFADKAQDPQLAETFRRLSRDEADHTEWWSELLLAHDAGLVPDTVNESDTTLAHLREVATTLDDGTLVSAAADDDTLIEAAIRMEFYLLDPVFAELIELTEPGSGERHRNAYTAHVERIASMIERHYRRNELASFLAGALRRAWRDQARSALLSRHDQLTGLFNRRGLFAYLDQWAAWSARYGKQLGFVLVDVDHFKQINDVHGHPAGDEALRAIASSLRRSVRAADILGRYGGDEFAIVAPETDRDGMIELLARVITEVPSLASHIASSQVPPLTVSAGGAVTNGEAIAVKDLLAAADESLYAAKQLGGAAAGPVSVLTAAG